MDVITFLIIMGAIIGAFVCVFIGRCLDVSYRQRIMRTLTKKDLGMLALMDRDKKRLLYIPVDFGTTTLMIDKNMWVFDKRHLYRRDKKELGFFIKDTMLKFEEGLPVLYVNKDSIKPVEFEGVEDPVKPAEIYAGVKAWIDNERAKLMATSNILKTLQMLLILCFVCSLASAGVSYMCMQEVQKAENQTAAMMTYLGMNSNVTYSTGR